MNPRYRLYLRTGDFRYLAEIDKFTELTINDRDNDVSTWILDMPGDQVPAVQADFVAGLIVQRDGKTILSGPITYIEQALQQTTTVRLAGVDDTVILSDVLALPVPSGPPYTAQAYDSQTGPAADVMRHYVNVNCGPSAILPRRRHGLTVPTGASVGKVVTANARFHSLLELLQSLALASGDISFKIVQVDDHLEFQVTAHQDKTRSVVFSPFFGTLRGYRYSISRSTGNYVYVGGGGEGIDRTIFEKGDDASITYFNARIERFRDRRDTSDPVELEQSADEEIAARANLTRLELKPIETARLRYGIEYGLGDKVSVITSTRTVGSQISTTPTKLSAFLATYFPVEFQVATSKAIIGTLDKSLLIQDTIREVQIVIKEGDGEVISPVVGTADSGREAIMELYKIRRDDSRRTANLERR